MPEAAEGYSFTPSEKLQGVTGDLTNDPAIKALQVHAKASGWTQGQYQDVLATLEVFADQGLLDPAFDPVAEQTKLGENGKAQMEEQESFLTSLKDRGDIDEEAFGELMSLVPTAAGTKALAALRKVMGPAGVLQAPTGVVTGGEAMKAEARQMRQDPRYDTDRNFRKEADAKFMAAWSSSGG